jgi:hypothetical protein
MQSLTATGVQPNENRVFLELRTGTAPIRHSFSWCDARRAASRFDSDQKEKRYGV